MRISFCITANKLEMQSYEWQIQQAYESIVLLYQFESAMSLSILYLFYRHTSRYAIFNTLSAKLISALNLIYYFNILLFLLNNKVGQDYYSQIDDRVDFCENLCQVCDMA